MSEAKEYSKETLQLQILDFVNKPISEAEVILLAMGQKQGQKITLQNKTNHKGLTSIDLQPYIKHINRFEVTINHPKYYTYPTNRTRKICRSYEYGHLCVEKFDKIPTFYFKDSVLNIIQSSNFIRQYKLKSTQKKDTQAQKEYYIHLESNQKSLAIYKDKNLTQKSEYELCLEYLQDTQQDIQTKNTNKLYFDDDEMLSKFKDEIEAIIIKNKKKGNAQSIHKFIIDYDEPDLIAKALHFIDEFEKRSIDGVFSNDNLSQLVKGDIERLIGNENPFDKSIIISILRERMVNLVANHNYKTKATLPNINNATKSYYPNQANASLCGPAAFFYCLLIDRPDLYVKCVIDLWENGETTIKRLKIKPSKTCKKPKILISEEYKDKDKDEYKDEYKDRYINGVDWITLASLRDSTNIFYAYDETDDAIAGITFAGEIKKWFEAVGSEISTDSNETYGLHISKEKLLALAKHKKNNPQSHIISVINAKVIGVDSKIPIIEKSHWAVWNTSPQSNKKDINCGTSNNASITQNIVSWGTINKALNGKYTLQDYLACQFGAIIASKIPYVLGEYE